MYGLVGQKSPGLIWCNFSPIVHGPNTCKIVIMLSISPWWAWCIYCSAPSAEVEHEKASIEDVSANGDVDGLMLKQIGAF